jgi:hypothetical protein
MLTAASESGEVGAPMIGWILKKSALDSAPEVLREVVKKGNYPADPTYRFHL